MQVNFNWASDHGPANIRNPGFRLIKQTPGMSTTQIFQQVITNPGNSYQWLSTYNRQNKTTKVRLIAQELEQAVLQENQSP